MSSFLLVWTDTYDLMSSATAGLFLYSYISFAEQGPMLSV
jgi:hypothetical protein